MSTMTPTEAVALCRFAKACCPQQAFDEYTPDAWFEMLGDLRFQDCKEALVNVAKRQPFVSPSEIREEVGRVRHSRIKRFGPFDPPAGADMDVLEYHRWLADMHQQIADGTLTRQEFDGRNSGWESLPEREMPALDGVFRKVPDDHRPESAPSEEEAHA